MSYLTLSALPAGILFALVTTITPGPNNTMLLASGVNFGFRRTLPHLSGISAGVVLLMLSVGIGLGEAFVHFPVLYTVLEVASVAYLLYLAWKIGTSGELKDPLCSVGPWAMEKAGSRAAFIHYYVAQEQAD